MKRFCTPSRGDHLLVPTSLQIFLSDLLSDFPLRHSSFLLWRSLPCVLLKSLFCILHGFYTTHTWTPHQAQRTFDTAQPLLCRLIANTTACLTSYHRLILPLELRYLSHQPKIIEHPRRPGHEWSGVRNPGGEHVGGESDTQTIWWPQFQPGYGRCSWAHKWPLTASFTLLTLLTPLSSLISSVVWCLCLEVNSDSF